MKYTYGVLVIGLLAASQGRAQTSSPVEQELIKVENEWNQAVIKRDAPALRRFYADEYLSTDPEGMVWNKAQDIAIDTTGASRVTFYKLDDLKVRIYGDVAVVTGRNTMKGTLHGGTASGRNRFTDVFVKRGGRWQCVTSQSTATTAG